MPNRILKESICTSDSVNSLGWFEEVLFYRLIVNCDDFGRYDARPLIIKNKLFPLKENLTAKNVTEAINKLARAGLVSLYTVDGKPFLFLPSWNDHQSQRAAKSKYPSPDDGDSDNSDESDSNGNHLQADECNGTQKSPYSYSNSYSNSISYSDAYNGEKRARFTKPTVEEIAEYCRERNNNIDAQYFYDYYERNGWMVGKAKMKDWKATVRTWERNSHSNNRGSTAQSRLDEVDTWV